MYSPTENLNFETKQILTMTEKTECKKHKTNKRKNKFKRYRK